MAHTTRHTQSGLPPRHHSGQLQPCMPVLRPAPAAVAASTAPAAAAAVDRLLLTAAARGSRATRQQQQQPPSPRSAVVVLCQSSTTDSSSSRGTTRRVVSRAAAPTQQPQQQHASKPLEPRIQVSINTSSGGVAKAVLLRLQQLGHVEVWATSAANHFTAVAGLGLAAQQLQRDPLPLPPSSQQQQQQQDDGAASQKRLLAGLAATAVMAAHDQPVKDDQKRRLNKLELQVVPAPQLDPALLAAGQAGAVSTNRTTGIAAVLDLMRQQLLEPDGLLLAAEAAASAGAGGDGSSSSGGYSSRVKPGAVCVVEARGEQAVTRALKAALSLQAAAGQPLLLRPVAGPVVDVVAEKRGQSKMTADGLLLLFSWA